MYALERKKSLASGPALADGPCDSRRDRRDRCDSCDVGSGRADSDARACLTHVHKSRNEPFLQNQGYNWPPRHRSWKILASTAQIVVNQGPARDRKRHHRKRWTPRISNTRSGKIDGTFGKNVMIFGGVQPFSTTLFGVPFPQPTPQGRWLSNLVRKGHEAPTRASLDR